MHIAFSIQKESAENASIVVRLVLLRKMGTIRASVSIMLTLKQGSLSTPILVLMPMAAVCARLAYPANQEFH